MTNGVRTVRMFSWDREWHDVPVGAWVCTCHRIDVFNRPPFTAVPPAGQPETTERVEILTALIHQYAAHQYAAYYEISELQCTPWPGDPDGGELRLVACLRDVLPYLTPEGLALAEAKLLPEED